MTLFAAAHSAARRLAPAHHLATVATALACLAPAGAWAQQADASAWGLGLAVAADRKPYRDFDDKVRPLPLLIYENRWISIAGPGVDFKLPSVGPVGLRLRARYGFDGYEAKDSPWLAGMNERKSSVWLGAAATWNIDIVQLSAELLADASGHSKGRQFALRADRRFQAGAFDITPRVAVQQQDRKYVDYYYGVESSEARLARPAYEGSSAVNLQVGVRVGYALAARQSVFVDVSTTRLGSSIRNSPLVNQSSQPAVAAGYLYRF